MQLSYKLIFFLSLMSVRGMAFDSLRTEQIDGKWVVIHQVEKGETLYSLSKRYQSDIEEIVSRNEIVDNTLSLDQLIQIPIDKEVEELPDSDEGEIVHVVKTGETLFSISRQYGLKVFELRQMNDLKGNEISIGQELVITRRGTVGTKPDLPDVDTDVPGKVIEKEEAVGTTVVEKADPMKGFILYQVQSGDDLREIGRKHGVRVDSIIYWNDLKGDFLQIGQQLKLKNKPELAGDEVKLENTPYGTRKRIIDNSGFIRVVEEGLAMKIEDVIETSKYLCLHRTLSVGSLVEVRNLMNNQKVFVKVVGKLPDTGLNEQVLIRLTPVAFKRLGIIDPRARVEISYFEV